MGWGKKPLTTGERMTLHVQQAAHEYDREKEEMETVQITLRALRGFLAECESNAQLRGSGAATAFKVLGQATQAFAFGTDKVIAALPPANPRCLDAARLVLGLEDHVNETVDGPPTK